MSRRVAVAITTTALVLAQAAPAGAHGIGGRLDLPVPVSFFVVGAGLAIVISFVLLSISWTEPRLQESPEPRPLRRQWALHIYRALRWIGLAGLVLVVVAGLIDGTTTRNSIAPVLVWVGFWLVVPFLSAGFGDLWRWMSPWRTLALWVNRDRSERPDILAKVGMWPAVIAFVAITWLELVSSTNTLPRTLATAAIVYTLYKLAITYWAGIEVGLEAGGGYANYTRLIGAIAPIEATPTPRRVSVGADTAVERRAGAVTYRGWLRGLPAISVRRGLTAFVVAMIGTVTYDGLSATGWWRELVGDLQRNAWFETLALVGTVVLIGAAYYGASWAARELASSSRSVADIASSFAHTLVPIGLAYAVAHYFTLVIFEGQLVLRMASDPFGLGWNLFGTADWTTVFWMSPTVVWWIQVATLVTGHIAGVVLAHDRALAEFGDRDAVRTQYAMLVLMVALTSLGLLILAG